MQIASDIYLASEMAYKRERAQAAMRGVPVRRKRRRRERRRLHLRPRVA